MGSGWALDIQSGVWMGSGYPQQCLDGLWTSRGCLGLWGCCHRALLLSHSTHWGPWDPAASLAQAKAAPRSQCSVFLHWSIHGCRQGLSPGPARSGVCGWGPHSGNLPQALQGTQGKHNSHDAEVQLLPVGSGGCVPEGPSSALSLQGSSSPLQQLPAPPPACPWRKGEETTPQCPAQAAWQRSHQSFSHPARPGLPGCAQQEAPWGGTCEACVHHPRSKQQ